MKKLTLLLLSILLLGTASSIAQKIYPITSGEMIFSSGTIEFKDEYINAQPEGVEATKVPLRFTIFFHLTQFWHVDLTENIGFFTGLGIRNVGVISDERLYNGSQGIESIQSYKIIRRLYTGGIPLALKIGSFKDNLYLFAGGEYEFAIHYKEKYWNSHERSGSKTKYDDWFGNQTPAFLPSVFVGAQFPGGFNAKFKYYMSDFLNHDYESSNFISDLTRYKTSQVWYISLSWQFNTAYLKKKSWDDDDFAIRY